MTTVREVTLELLRAHGMTTIFGNPGSTELPMLAELPDDFTYVLGLQELVVVGMADGFAQAARRPGHANLHTGPGVGNAMGGILNAAANRTPLLITAGQQARPQVTIEATLTNRDAVALPLPHVRYRHEPPRAADVPTAIARAIQETSIPPRGPAFVSIPMDDWSAEADPERARPALARSVHAGAVPDPAALDRLGARLRAARAPLLVAGPEIDVAGAFADAVAFAEALGAPVWSPPITGGARIGFPEAHPLFQGLLPPAIGPLAETLAGHDLVLVAGAAVFAYYPYLPGPLLPEGTELVLLTADPQDAARAPMGEAILGEIGAALRTLRAGLTGGGAQAAVDPRASRPPVAPRAAPAPAERPDGGSGRMTPEAAIDALAAAWPRDGVCVAETPSSMVALRDRLRLSAPGSWYFSASGGLGFAIAAAPGVALADPARPVVCVLGEGSAQYGITALWTAAVHRLPVTFVVLRNDEYAILKWFGALEGANGAPGLELPGLDTAAVARAYGVAAESIADPEALVAALRTAVGAGDGPRLIEVPVTGAS
jgi:benzoylformate decarboxylase